MTEQPDFLSRMVDRALERVPVVEPRELSCFETRRTELPEIPMESFSDQNPTPNQSPPPALSLPPMRPVLRVPSEVTAPIVDSEKPIAQDFIENEPQGIIREITQEKIHPLLIERIRPAAVARAAAPPTPTPIPKPITLDEPAPVPKARTETLLPKQSIIQTVVAQTIGSPSQAAEPAPSENPERAADTVVNVTIGRVEVRASAPSQKTSVPAKTVNRHQPMTLNEYLKTRGGPR